MAQPSTHFCRSVSAAQRTPDRRFKAYLFGVRATHQLGSSGRDVFFGRALRAHFERALHAVAPDVRRTRSKRAPALGICQSAALFTRPGAELVVGISASDVHPKSLP